MQYTVVITKEPDTSWRAFAPFLPDCEVNAATREEVLEQITERIAQRQVEIIQIDVPVVPLNGAAAYTTFEQQWPEFGKLRGDKAWEAVFDEIEQERDRN